MLLITQNKVNKLVTTLTEFKITNTSIYLLELTNQDTKERFYCVCTDLSCSKNRSNSFCVTETYQSSGGTNPLNAQVALSLPGFYYYNVYENPDSILNPSGLNKVETGKLLVIENLPISPTKSYVNETYPDKKVYNREFANFV